MTYFTNIYWCLFCFLSIKVLEAAKIYVIELTNTEDDAALLNNYHDYDPINEFAYDDHYKRHRIIKVNPEKVNQDNKPANVVMCERLFGSMFGNRDRHVRCLEALKINKRSSDYSYNLQQRKKLQNRPVRYHTKGVRQKNYVPFLDLTRFSQDYLDVNDLGRSEGFASDYVDVDDFKIARELPECKDIDIDAFGEFATVNCAPESRKWGLAIDENNDKFFSRGKGIEDDSTDSSDDASTERKKYTRKKPKRYKVVSNGEDSKDSSEKDDNSNDRDSTPHDNNSASETDDVSAGSGVQNSESSIEVTTKRPKSNRKETGRFEDKYVYVQGNKYFDKDDFRRGLKMRMPYFFPNRFHWDEEDYHDLGYFWFNGPKGKYRTP